MVKEGHAESKEPKHRSPFRISGKFVKVDAPNGSYVYPQSVMQQEIARLERKIGHVL